MSDRFQFLKAKNMKISVFGLGYVGCVSLGCLAQNGHHIIGVDVNINKVNLINAGKPTIIEKDIDIIIKEQFRKKRISATVDFKKAVKETEISIICVGTPSTNEGHLDLINIYKVAEEIAEAINEKKEFHTVVIRSTVLPGTNQKVGEIIEKFSGKKRNKNFSVVSNPEFLREGSAVHDYYNPPLTVLGSDNEKALDIMADIYSKVNGPIEKVEIKVAEIIKYVNNSFHALKIVFANEVGNICKKTGIDSHEVMRIFCMDKQLNISNYYFKPGFAYGGSCLPKDLQAFKKLAHDHYLESPVLNSIEKSNSYQKELALNTILETGKQKIGFLSISFKSGTDDFRYSPSVEVIEQLIGKGKDVLIYDNNVNISKLVGSNKSYINKKLPHISELLKDNIDEILNWADVIVLTNQDEIYNDIQIKQNQVLIDFAYFKDFEKLDNYIGLCW